MKFGTMEGTFVVPNFTLIGPYSRVFSPKNDDIWEVFHPTGATPFLDLSEIYVVHAGFPSVVFQIWAFSIASKSHDGGNSP